MLQLSKILATFIPVLVTLIGIGCIFAIGAYWHRRQSRQRRESPLTRSLIRPPGYSLKSKIDDLNFDIDVRMMGLVVMPAAVFAVHVSQSHFGGVEESGFRAAVSILTGLVFMGIAGTRFLRLLHHRRQLVLGLEGEMFTGEELNQLMLHGCRVFHDIEFPYGNIDHVVVSHSGVYLVNTKVLCKAKDGTGRAEVVVDHHSNIIRFPDWDYSLPIAQLETEANWLSKYLSSAVGTRITAEPMIALPGWKVKERIGRSSVYVINPESPKKFFVQNRHAFSPSEIQQIAHQLEQLCRNVEPSFREKKGWANVG